MVTGGLDGESQTERTKLLEDRAGVEVEDEGSGLGTGTEGAEEEEQVEYGVSSVHACGRPGTGLFLFSTSRDGRCIQTHAGARAASQSVDPPRKQQHRTGKHGRGQR